MNQNKASSKIHSEISKNEADNAQIKAVQKPCKSSKTIVKSRFKISVRKRQSRKPNLEPNFKVSAKTQADCFDYPENDNFDEVELVDEKL